MARCLECGGTVKWKNPFYVCMDCGVSYRKQEFAKAKDAEIKKRWYRDDEEDPRKKQHDALMKWYLKQND